MKNFLHKAFEMTNVGFVFLVALFFLVVFLKLIIEPLAPIVTILVVLIATVNTFDKWTTAVLSVGGIILYAASWYVLDVWGVWPSTIVWAIGVILWFIVVSRSFLKSKHYLPIREIFG